MKKKFALAAIDTGSIFNVDMDTLSMLSRYAAGYLTAHAQAQGVELEGCKIQIMGGDAARSVLHTTPPVDGWINECLYIALLHGGEIVRVFEITDVVKNKINYIEPIRYQN